MIPPDWDSDRACYGASSNNDELRAKHAGHRNQRDCYRAIWQEPPLPWVKRQAPPRTRSWHLAIGIRHDSGEVQTKCNVGHGAGPWFWREVPALSYYEETGEWFCRRCIAEWTRRIEMATVNTGVKMTKAAFKALADRIEKSVGVIEIEIRMASVENAPALIAELRHEEQRESWTEKLLVVNDGVVKIS